MIESAERVAMVETIVTKLSEAKPWVEITDLELDPEAVSQFAFRFEGSRSGSTVFVLSRYEDGGERYALVSISDRGARLLSKEDSLLESLWAKVKTEQLGCP